MSFLTIYALLHGESTISIDSANTIIGTVLLTPRGYLSLYLAYWVVALLLIGATRGRLSSTGDFERS